MAKNKTPKAAPAPAELVDPILTAEEKGLQEQPEPQAPEATSSDLPGTSSQPEQPAATPKAKAKIPKAGEEKARTGQPQRKLENTDVSTDLDLEGSDITFGKQVNPEEAFGYAMTQADPVRAIRELAKRNQLKDITGTYQLMETNGMTMARA